MVEIHSRNERKNSKETADPISSLARPAAAPARDVVKFIIVYDFFTLRKISGNFTISKKWQSEICSNRQKKCDCRFISLLRQIGDIAVAVLILPVNKSSDQESSQNVLSVSFILSGLIGRRRAHKSCREFFHKRIFGRERLSCSLSLKKQKKKG